MVEQVGDFAARVQAKQIAFDLERTLFFLAGGLNNRRWRRGEGGQP